MPTQVQVQSTIGDKDILSQMICQNSGKQYQLGPLSQSIGLPFLHQKENLLTSISVESCHSALLLVRKVGAWERAAII